MATQGNVVSKAEVQAPLGDAKIRLLRFELREALSEPFELRVEMASEQPGLDTAAAIGKPLVVKLTLPDGKVRHLHGLVAQAGLIGAHRARLFRYDAVVRPGFWFLTHTRRSRVFANDDALGIVKAVLGKASALVAFDVKATKTYTKRPYCVQYQESDFDFVSRLLEEEGIYYYFKHTAGSHPMVLADGPGAHEPIVSSARMDYRPGTSKASNDADSVLAWQYRDAIGPGKFSLRDYDFERSTTKLDASASARSHAHRDLLEVEVFPEGYLLDGGDKGADKGPGGQQAQHFASVMAEQRDATAREVAGATDALAMACGCTFEVARLPAQAHDGKYLATRTRLEFQQGSGERDNEGTSYACQFSALSNKAPFRPALVTPKPRMWGPQTAVVIGDGEIAPDEYGRVKVRFFWGPSDAQSSAWVRVSHPWASKGFGMVALPRVGDEVVVDFIDGDPDHPLVTGRVYNAQNMPPYKLAAQKTVTGIRTRSSEGGGEGNFNELRFDDKKGSEYVWFQAEKTYHRLVKEDAFDVVGNDEHVEVKRDRTEKIGRDWQMEVAQHHIEKIGGDAQLEIARDSIASVGSNLDASVGSNMTMSVGANTTVNVGSSLMCTVGASTGLTTATNLDVNTGAAAALHAGGNLDVHAGGNAAIEAGAKMDLKSGAKTSIEAGAQMAIKAGITISIGAAASITLKAGPSTIMLGPSGVSISGPMVMINSGGGGMNASSAAAAKEAKKADKTDPKKPKDPAKPGEQKDPIQS